MVCGSATDPSWAPEGVWFLLRKLFLKKSPSGQLPYLRPGCQFAGPLTALEAVGHPLLSQPSPGHVVSGRCPIPSSDQAAETSCSSLLSSLRWPREKPPSLPLTEVSGDPRSPTAVLSNEWCYSLLPAPCWVGLSKGVPFAPNLWAEKQLSKSNRKSKVTRRVVEIGFELATLPVHQGSPGRSCVLTSFKGKKMCCQKYILETGAKRRLGGKGCPGPRLLLGVSVEEGDLGMSEDSVYAPAGQAHRLASSLGIAGGRAGAWPA